MVEPYCPPTVLASDIAGLADNSVGICILPTAQIVHHFVLPYGAQEGLTSTFMESNGVYQTWLHKPAMKMHEMVAISGGGSTARVVLLSPIASAVQDSTRWPCIRE